MAEQERLTKAERREQARAERRRKEAEEAARAKRRRITSSVVGVLILGFVGWVLWLAFAGGPGDLGDDPVVVDPVAASDAREAAGCEPLPVDLSGNAQHFEAGEAPPADTLYTLRPTASGPHLVRPIPPGVYRSGMDERASTHSMEHGGVVIWYDPDQVSGDEIGEIADWAETLNANGFANPQTGAGIFAAPFEGEFTSGKPIALRAWGAALDCQSFDETVANAFVIDHFGTHGVSPERNLGPYPEEVLVFGPGADETEDPNGGLEVQPEPAPTATTGEGEGGDMETDTGGTDESPSSAPSPTG